MSNVEWFRLTLSPSLAASHRISPQFNISYSFLTYLYRIDKGTPLPSYLVRTNTVPSPYQNRAPLSGDICLVGLCGLMKRDSPNFLAGSIILSPQLWIRWKYCGGIYKNESSIIVLTRFYSIQIFSKEEFIVLNTTWYKADTRRI